MGKGDTKRIVGLIRDKFADKDIVEAINDKRNGDKEKFKNYQMGLFQEWVDHGFPEDKTEFDNLFGDLDTRKIWVTEYREYINKALESLYRRRTRDEDKLAKLTQLNDILES